MKEIKKKKKLDRIKQELKSQSNKKEKENERTAEKV